MAETTAGKTGGMMVGKKVAMMVLWMVAVTAM